MTALDLIASLRDRGVNLTARGDRLRIDAPKGVLTDTLRATLRDRKADVLEALVGTVDDATDCDTLPTRTVNGFDVPAGWTTDAWRDRLRQLAAICINQRRAVELREWADGLDGGG